MTIAFNGLRGLRAIDAGGVLPADSMALLVATFRAVRLSFGIVWLQILADCGQRVTA